MRPHTNYLTKPILLIAALLITTLSNVSIASAAACTSNCLRVYSIQLVDLGSYINGTVKLIDETGSGGGARSSTVHAVWTRPDGTTLDQYANIGTRLRAEFRLNTNAAPGVYTLRVVDVTKAGYTFDTKGSTLLQKKITVGIAGNEPPTAVPNADLLSGPAPLTVNFDSSASTDSDGYITSYYWDFSDGSSSSSANPTHTFSASGNYLVRLQVTDNEGGISGNTLFITATDNSGGCISNCITVDNILMTYRVRSARINGYVDILDENSQGVKNAEVIALWRLPDGSSIEQTVNSGKKSRARFTLTADTGGVYTLTVLHVNKAGFSFDADNSNMLHGMIDVAP